MSEKKVPLMQLLNAIGLHRDQIKEISRPSYAAWSSTIDGLDDLLPRGPVEAMAFFEAVMGIASAALYRLHVALSPQDFALLLELLVAAAAVRAPEGRERWPRLVDAPPAPRGES